LSKFIVPLCLFTVVATLFFATGGSGVGIAKPNLTVAAGELSVWEDWSINPCKYNFNHAGKETIAVKVSNKSGEFSYFDMGDGNSIGIEPYSSATYYYSVQLKKDTVKFSITKLVDGQGGISIETRYTLKIESIKKGGDTR